ncbi:MAG: hypothetical protein KC417_00530 [Myxococcales bacterium]|nr:hypothetical protein [Myxococcales bacterium]
MRSAGWALLLGLLVCSRPGAVARADGETGSLTIHPDEALRSFAIRVAETLERRTGRRVRVGDAPPGGVPEAVPAGDLALVRDGDAVVLTRANAQGGVSRASLTIARLDDGAVRATALTIETMEDAAAELESAPASTGPAERRAPGANESDWVYRAYAREDSSRLPSARPAFMGRFMGGYSPVDHMVLLGPGLAFGLCVRNDCFMIEMEVPLFAQSTTLPQGGRVRFRSVNLSARIQYRPLTFGRITPGINAGFVTRVGSAVVAGDGGGSQATTDLRARISLELAVRLVGVVEALAEVGSDLVIDAASVRTEGELRGFRSDPTPWAIAGIRIRP